MSNVFDVTKVKSVYSGRKGCACGCRGKYSYASRYRDQRPSYYEADECINDRTVKSMVTKVERILNDGRRVKKVHVDDKYMAVDMDWDRTYTVYFAE